MSNCRCPTVEKSLASILVRNRRRLHLATFVLPSQLLPVLFNLFFLFSSVNFSLLSFLSKNASKRIARKDLYASFALADSAKQRAATINSESTSISVVGETDSQSAFTIHSPRSETKHVTVKPSMNVTPQFQPSVHSFTILPPNNSSPILTNQADFLPLAPIPLDPQFLYPKSFPLVNLLQLMVLLGSDLSPLLFLLWKESELLKICLCLSLLQSSCLLPIDLEF